MESIQLGLIPIQEDWNYYVLADGKPFKLMLKPKSIGKESTGDGGTLLRVEFLVLHNLNELGYSKGQSTGTEQVTKNDVVEFLRFTPIKESINIYQLNKELLVVSPALKEMGKTDKFNKDGDRLFYFEVTTKLSWIPQ